MISYIGYITCRYGQLTKVFLVDAIKIVGQSATLFKTKSTLQCFPKSFKSFLNSSDVYDLTHMLRSVFATRSNTYDKTVCETVNGL